MHTRSLPDYKIRYGINHIELHGERLAIHQEAKRIERQFAASALPYRVVADFDDYMLLRAVH
jgi:hypothetical protein